VFVWLRISSPRIKLASSNFARCFIGILGRQSYILGNFAPSKAQNRTHRAWSMSWPICLARWPRIGSACVDIRPSPKTDLMVWIYFVLLSIVWSTVSWQIADLNYCRSPWTSQYDPPLEDGTQPSEKLRKLEIEANSAFDQFREM